MEKVEEVEKETMIVSGKISGDGDGRMDKDNGGDGKR